MFNNAQTCGGREVAMTLKLRINKMDHLYRIRSKIRNTNIQNPDEKDNLGEVKEPGKELQQDFT